jgi:hypothetical protein
MKKYYQIIVYVIIFGSLGCSYDTAKENIKQDAAAVSIVSAMVVALPLIPLAEAYHIVNQTDKKIQENADYWESVLNPVYEERTQMIHARSPEEDAETIFNNGDVVYFPTTLDEVPNYELGAIYPGVEFYPFFENDKVDSWQDPDQRKNRASVAHNELANYLWTLMSKDPKHETYSPKTYGAFFNETQDYKEAFNLRMFELASKRTHSITASGGSE